MYLTPEEYIMLGGIHEELTPADIMIYQLQFDGMLEPNTAMIPVYFAKHGAYPFELKLAMTQYIDYLLENKAILNSFPNTKVMVGTTGLANGETMQRRWGDPDLMVSPLVRNTLRPTNLINPGYMSSVLRGCPLVMRGTPWAMVDPLFSSGEGVTNTTIQAYAKKSFDVNEALKKVPTLRATFFRTEVVMVPGTSIASDKHTSTILGYCRIHYEDVGSTEQTRGYCIVPPKFHSGEEVRLQPNDMVEVETPLGNQSRVVEEVHAYFESDIVHHYRVMLS